LFVFIANLFFFLSVFRVIVSLVRVFRWKHRPLLVILQCGGGKCKQKVLFFHKIPNFRYFAPSNGKNGQTAKVGEFVYYAVFRL